MNDLHELAKVSTALPHYTRPERGRWHVNVHQYIGSALILAGGFVFILAVAMRQQGAVSPRLTLAAYCGAAAFILGNVWYLAGWLAKRWRR
jgi:hypothetical protein